MIILVDRFATPAFGLDGEELHPSSNKTRSASIRWLSI
jgi:hypothetical protein